MAEIGDIEDREDESAMNADPGFEETAHAPQATLELELEREERRWLGEPVYKYAGPVKSVPTLPHFERHPFAIGGVPQDGVGPFPLTPWLCGESKYWDVIVRMPVRGDEKPTPVAIVSKHYKLVQHRDVFDATREAIQRSEIRLQDVSVELKLSVYGGRMEVIFDLPQRFSVDPGDGYPLTLQLMCVNSVDGRARLTFMMGWYRFICDNGLIAGTSRLAQRLVTRRSKESGERLLSVSGPCLDRKREARRTRTTKRNAGHPGADGRIDSHQA